MEDLSFYLALILLVALSAFFSSSEIALAKSNKVRIHLAAEHGDEASKILDRLNQHYVESISTILIGNNLVNIATTSVATMLMVKYFGTKYGPAVASTGTTIILLIFGETVPKILASAMPEKTARLFCWPLQFFMMAFAPIVRLMTKLVNMLSPLWASRESAPQITTEELCEILGDIEDAGVFTEEESSLIRSAIEFTETTANEILTPRVDVFALDVDEFNLEQALKEESFRHSLIPVYRDTIDNIIGILPAKRLLRELAKEMAVSSLTDFLVEPLYVHKTCPLSTMLELFQREQLQLAIVLDEFGGMLGIVTMEDVLEEIVGEIYDERDIKEEADICQENDTTYIVDGGTNIYDLFDHIGYRPAPDFDTEYTTVGGWITELLDKFPKEGDNLLYDRFQLTVLETESKRVRTLRITLLPQSTAALK